MKAISLTSVRGFGHRTPRCARCCAGRHAPAAARRFHAAPRTAAAMAGGAPGDNAEENLKAAATPASKPEPEQQQQQEQQQEQQPPQPQPVKARSGGLAAAFEALPPRVRLYLLGGAFAVAMVVLPFIQPYWIYGDGGASAPAAAANSSTKIADEQPAKPPSRPIPIITPALETLQQFAMPRTLPDGRVESPGVVRIYVASMVILGAFYAVSGALQLVLNGVVAGLRAVGVLRPNGSAQRGGGTDGSGLKQA